MTFEKQPSLLLYYYRLLYISLNYIKRSVKLSFYRSIQISIEKNKPNIIV